jgi:ferredoxin
MSIFKRAIKKLTKNNTNIEYILEIEGMEPHKIKSNTLLLSAIQNLDVDIDFYCGGTCSCGTCYIKVIEGMENLSKASSREKLVLGYEKSISKHRLACQARILGNVKIKTPEY